MAIRVSGKNLDIGDSLRAQVEARVAAALTKYADGRGSGHVVVSRDGSGFRTECVVNLGSGMTLESAGLANDAYASFDQSALRIEKRMRRHKRRIKDRLGDGAAVRGATGPESAYAILEAPDDEALEEEYHPVVIAETTRPLSRLSVSEAVIELDLSGSPVVVFRHAGNGRVNVVYRRGDGSIGWVDPPTADS
ncbi:ribosome-associated translation inhibitor RaiA [Enterovirga sp.]|jgi:ribosomal subunit interface protein|uniref:ribosome hibernation-promoting factor, HPF/YfiA family n=1 Tax=Enterovirga sp. TaxID=2026350 RepID=UPI002626E888|nr:ribosome-associated translation inhibitor RaiA [Enterovirga sp.]MDB5590192.1 ribosomal subunit interface protein [Enterovirga sp.]